MTHEERVLEVHERARKAAAARDVKIWRSVAARRIGMDPNRDSPRQTYAIVGLGTERVKIGSAVSIMTRGLSLQCGSPVELVLVGYCAADIEASLHEALRESRAHREWFHLDNKVRKAIAANMQQTHFSFLTSNVWAHGIERLENPEGDLFR